MGGKSTSYRLPVSFPDPALLARIDDWRREQPDIPGRAEAVRRLVETALEQDGAADKE